MRILLSIFAVSLLVTYVSASCDFCIRGYGNWSQHYGYVNLPGRCGSPFYWFYQSLKERDIKETHSTTPLIVVAGCPGQSAVGYHNFMATGPEDIYGNRRINSLIEENHVLYVDPPGVGFAKCDCNQRQINSSEIGSDLKAVVTDFLESHPQYQTSPLFVLGDGICAKPAVELTNQLYDLVTEDICKANFKGLFLTAPWISPIDHVMSWADYLIDHGHIDTYGKEQYDAKARTIENNFNRKLFKQAMLLYHTHEEAVDIRTGDICYISNNFVDETTKQKSKVLKAIRCRENNELNRFMNMEVKPVLSRMVSSKTSFNQHEMKAIAKTRDDFLSSCVPQLGRIMKTEELSVNVLISQNDVLCNHRGAERWIQKLEWSGKYNWKNAPYQPIVQSETWTPTTTASTATASTTNPTTTTVKITAATYSNTTVPNNTLYYNRRVPITDNNNKTKYNDYYGYKRSRYGRNIKVGYSRRYHSANYFMLFQSGHELFNGFINIVPNIINKVISEVY